MDGQRRTVGRPKGRNYTQCPLKLRNDLYEYASSQPNRGRFINECIEERMLRDREKTEGRDNR